MGSSGEEMGSVPNLVNISQNVRRMVLDDSESNDVSNHTVATLFEEMCVNSHGSLLCEGLLGYWIESNPRTVVNVCNHERRFDQCAWLPYLHTFMKIRNFSSGLASIGLEEEEKVAIVASTCAESFIALQACFRRRAIAVTLDTWLPLGEETLVHILNEAGVSTVVCDKSQAKKLVIVQKKLKTVKRIIYVDQDYYSPQPLSFEVVPEIDVQSFSDVEKRASGSGHSSANTMTRSPSPADIALIMYTRATTSSPQGVLITHKSLLTAVSQVSKVLPHLCSKDVYFACSPFPHILELIVEIYIALSGRGARIGYASRGALIDASELLRPTIVMTVPTLLDHVKDSVRKTVNKRPWISKKLFNLGYSRLVKAMEGSWHGHIGLEKKFWNFIVFNKLKAKFGNRLRTILLYGGPLSEDTQSFINICFRTPIIPVDDLTESLSVYKMLNLEFIAMFQN